MTNLDLVSNALTSNLEPALLVDIIAETELTQKQVENALFSLIKSKFVTKAGIGQKALFSAVLVTESASSESVVDDKKKTEKVTKPAATETETEQGVITLKSICMDLNVATTFARRKLRKANYTKPAKGWSFPKGTDIKAIIKIIK